jgi:4-amino-4-deoxy-L-arabinose transferase-like glycosyltransferase
MPQLLRHQAWIALAAGLVLFTNLGVPQLWDDDEPRNATCAREMLVRGDLIVPTFNEDLRIDKPVLIYWLMMTAYKVFGPTEFAARFWSAVLAVGTSLMTYHLGRLLFRPAVGLWAGLIVASSLMFDVAGRAATPDSTLIFCTTLALLLFVIGGRKHAASFTQPTTWSAYALVYLAMGLAVLAKGPVGVVLPGGVLGLYLCCLGTRSEVSQPAIATRSKKNISVKQQAILASLSVWNWLKQLLAPRNVWRALWTMRPVTALIVIAAVALPWYIAVGVETDGEWLRGFLGKHNVNRFLKPMEGHKGPIFYYIPAIFIGFFPWSVFLPLSVIDLAKRLRQRHATANSYLLLACWSGLYIGFFSLSRTKLPSYVLPAYPALALMTAALVDHWITSPASIGRGWLRLALGSIAAGGVGILVGVPIAAKIALPGEAILGLCGLAPLAGAILAWYWMERQQAHRAMVTVGATAVVLATSMFGLATVRVSSHQNSASIVQRAHEAGDAEPTLATFGHSSPSLVYYAGRRVETLSTLEQVGQFFREARSPMLVTRADRYEELQYILPNDITVLERQPRFLKKGEVLLLGRPTQTAAGSRKSPK